MVLGGLDFGETIRRGEPVFQPGLLARAHGGILYVDEVNLLDDHLVDVILDAAASGVNVIEREGTTLRHAARFTLVDAMNPEEGELRPQLLDRFGLCVTVRGASDLKERVEVMERRVAFDETSEAFAARWQGESERLARRMEGAMALVPQVTISRKLITDIAAQCLDLGVDGHRGDIIMMKTAKTLAAYEGRAVVTPENVEEAAQLVLPHRVRRQPMQDVAEDLNHLRRPREKML